VSSHIIPSALKYTPISTIDTLVDLIDRAVLNSLDSSSHALGAPELGCNFWYVVWSFAGTVDGISGEIQTLFLANCTTPFCIHAVFPTICIQGTEGLRTASNSCNASQEMRRVSEDSARGRRVNALTFLFQIQSHCSIPIIVERRPSYSRNGHGAYHGLPPPGKSQACPSKAI
jgi:hypothetical protein